MAKMTDTSLSKVDNEKHPVNNMEKRQSRNIGEEVPLREDLMDEDESRLVIDESSLPSEEKEEKPRTGKGRKRPRKKSRKAVQEVENTYPCPSCGKTFRRKVKLQTHLKTHKSKEKLECEDCGKQFRKEDTLINHICNENNYKCDDCGERFRYKKDLSNHQQTHRKPLTIDMPCDEKESSEESDFSSFVASFVKWPVTCTQCGIELSNLQSYNLHMASHKGGGPCLCFNCKTRFSCKDDYLLHKEVCHIGGLFQYTECGEKIGSESKLKHIDSRSSEKVNCDICGLGFDDKDKLASHLKVHNKNLLSCMKCKKIFKCNISLKNHNCVPEHSSKKLSDIFQDRTEKLICESYDSLSSGEGSDTEDAEMCQVISENHHCKVCGDSFQEKQAFVTHLETHFQCVACKKLFKTQADLDMHKFLLAEEKLYSCCLCEAVVHGKKELEYHLSSHVDDISPEDLEWEELLENLQNMTSKSDYTEPISGVKIHKVTPAGRNTLKCSECGKFVPLHHDLTADMETSTPTADSGDEYIYISRLESPKSVYRQMDGAYCSCNQDSGDILAKLSELGQTLNKSQTDCEDKETQKTCTTSQLLHPAPTQSSSPERSFESKCKIFLSDATTVDPDLQLDVSSTSKSDSEHCILEILDPEAERSPAEKLKSTKLPENNNITSTPCIADLNVLQKDLKNKSNSLKSDFLNTKEGNQKENNSSVKPSPKITLANKIVSKPSITLSKELVASNDSDVEALLDAELKILLSQQNSSLRSSESPIKVPQDLGLNEEMVPGFKKVSMCIPKHDSKKTLDTSVNTGKQEEAVLLIPKKVNKLQDNSPPKSKKIKMEGSHGKPSSAQTQGVTKNKSPTSNLNTNRGKGPTLKTAADSDDLLRVRAENMLNKRRRSSTIRPASAVRGAKAKPNHSRRPRTDSIVLKINDVKTRVPIKNTQRKKSSEPKDTNVTRFAPSTLNTAGETTPCVPEPRMTFKVEKLGYDSDEDESLDFAGIKKEFLASDVFIKEEWDIVDF